MEQYRMCELEFRGEKLEEKWAQVPLSARLWCGGREIAATGFYAGEGVYKVRFLPDRAGIWNYEVSGCIETAGRVEVAPVKGGHGLVRAQGQHFVHQDGTAFSPFGTTVYALMHQEDALVAQTFDSLRTAPFNKVRFCVFPKHYDYNHNEPQYYAFEQKAGGGEAADAVSGDGTSEKTGAVRRECAANGTDAVQRDSAAEAAAAAQTEITTESPGAEKWEFTENSWDVTRPCLAFWDRLDKIILQLDEMGIQADLILFHPYDRWGFSKLSQADNLVYLDYLTRRLAAMPNVWWSLANEYDLCAAKSLSDWEKIEEFVASHDPYRHLLSNHNCFKNWDFTRPNVTHACIQSKALTRVAHWRRQYQKPVVIDECCYEGNLQHIWGSISGKEMTNRFWRVVTMGGYCTHGETFLDPEDILWWARGGRLKGESPARIRFLREIVESLPGPIEPMENWIAQIANANSEEKERIYQQGDAFVRAMLNMKEELKDFYTSEFVYQGHCGEDAYLTFYDLRTCGKDVLKLPEGHRYQVELIDTWEMTRTVLLESASGETELALPGKEGMAVLAVRVPDGSLGRAE